MSPGLVHKEILEDKRTFAGRERLPANQAVKFPIGGVVSLDVDDLISASTLRTLKMARAVMPPSRDGGTLAPFASSDGDIDDGETF